MATATDAWDKQQNIYRTMMLYQESNSIIARVKYFLHVVLQVVFEKFTPAQPWYWRRQSAETANEEDNV